MRKQQQLGRREGGNRWGRSRLTIGASRRTQSVKKGGRGGSQGKRAPGGVRGAVPRWIKERKKPGLCAHGLFSYPFTRKTAGKML